MRGAYDDEQLEQAARMLQSAAASLRQLTNRLNQIGDGLAPREVADVVGQLRDHGRRMTSDIGEHTDLTAARVFQTAALYRDMNESMIYAFRGGE